MPVLGLDTATALTCVAAVHSGVVEYESAQEPPDPETGRPGHAQQLLPAVEECLRAVGGWGTIERIGVGVGPGSYTGLRVGIATARMLGRARGIDVFPVCTLDALAQGIDETGLADSVPRIAAIDARRNEVFIAAYEPDGARSVGPAVVSEQELFEAVAAAGAGALAAGDGALRFRAAFEAAGATVPPGDDPAHMVAARHVCRLTESAPEPPPKTIEPIYLREPDARRWRDRDGVDKQN